VLHVGRAITVAVLAAESRVVGVLSMRSRLLDAGGSGTVAALVDGSLKLLEELVDLNQVLLGASV